MCLPIPAAGKTNISLPGNPKQSLTHTHGRVVLSQPRARGDDKKSFVHQAAPRDPHSRTSESDPNPGPRARSSKLKRVELPGAGRDLQQRDDPGGDKGQEPPQPRGHPQDCPVGRVAQTDIVLLTLSPCRTQSQPRVGMFNELRTKLLPPQQTPSDGRNPPKAAITQLRRIWVTAVSHGHPESDSTLLEGPDPAADFPGRGSKTPREGKDGRTSPADLSPASSGMLPGQEKGSKCIP